MESVILQLVAHAWPFALPQPFPTHSASDSGRHLRSLPMRTSGCGKRPRDKSLSALRMLNWHTALAPRMSSSNGAITICGWGLVAGAVLVASVGISNLL